MRANESKNESKKYLALISQTACSKRIRQIYESMRATFLFFYAFYENLFPVFHEENVFFFSFG